MYFLYRSGYSSRRKGYGGLAMGSMSREQMNYNDGITKITDPFWTFNCTDCGHAGWSLTFMECCPDCGSVDAVFKNTKVKSPSS